MPLFFRMLIGSLILAIQLAFGSEPIDLRPIQHKFVELGPREERHYITNVAQWRAFWRRFSNQHDPNTIDFEKHDVVIFLMGTKPSGGYSAKIESVEKKQLHITAGNVVHILLCYPNPNEPQLAEVTSPFAVKIVPKRQGKILWETRQQETGKRDCK